jgi:hypothetical protein
MFVRAQLSLAALPRPLLIGGGAIAAVAVVALVHLAGADLRAGYGIGHPGLVPGLVQGVIAEGRGSTWTPRASP